MKGEDNMCNKRYNEDEQKNLDEIIHSDNYILVDKDYYSEMCSKMTNIDNLLKQIKNNILESTKTIPNVDIMVNNLLLCILATIDKFEGV